METIHYLPLTEEPAVIYWTEDCQGIHPPFGATRLSLMEKEEASWREAHASFHKQRGEADCGKFSFHFENTGFTFPEFP